MMTDLCNAMEDKMRSKRVVVRRTYIAHPMDAALDEALAYITQNIKDFECGEASPRRGFFVIGAAGTGKSSAIKHALSNASGFQSEVDQYGETVRFCVSVKLPKKCQTKDIVIATLKQMNLPHDGNERELTDFLLKQLKERRVKVLHFDELQHTVRSSTSAAFEAAQDFLKQLMQMDDWPLHIICSGMPKIENLRADDQIARRSKVIPFHAMQIPADASYVSGLVSDVAVKGCGLSLSEELTKPEFIERLCLSTQGASGTTIEMIQASSFFALARGRKQLTIRHFAKEYEASTGCSNADNVFLADNFKDIEPGNSLASLTEE